ncbi:MAG: TRAP transporter small permease subunit [Betaproteobacteria bacterium]|nr:TRAP transporter small permease subunit [Betaproteobacteria bacterium]
MRAPDPVPATHNKIEGEGMESMLGISDAINRVLGKIAMAVGWLFLVATIVIIFDVLSRKFGYQIPGMGSTRLQELEWHLHTALFSFWIGVGYVRNTHVRIDVAVTGAKPRTQAWLEFIGCLIFAFPYTLIAIYFAWDFAATAFIDMEGSESANGLPYRWIPKGFILAGLVLLLLAVISVFMRLIVFLYGPERLRAAASYGGAKVEPQAAS